MKSFQHKGATSSSFPSSIFVMTMPITRGTVKSAVWPISRISTQIKKLYFSGQKYFMTALKP